MFSKVGKTLLHNVIRHTDTHNRLLEEREMWSQRESEMSRNDRSRYDDRRDGRVKSSCQKVPRAHMDRADETRPHIYTDREPEQKSTYFMRQLQKAEEANPDRWGHGGYKEMYPEYFRSDRSESEDSYDDRQRTRETRSKHKTKKTKKRKEKKEKKKPRKKSAYKKKSSSSRRSSSRSERRREMYEKKPVINVLDDHNLVMNNMIKRKSKRMRVEEWVEKTCEYVNSADYEPESEFYVDSASNVSKSNKDSNVRSRDSSSSNSEDGANNKGGKNNRTYRKRARSSSSSDSGSSAASASRRKRRRSKQQSKSSSAKRKGGRRKGKHSTSSSSSSSSVQSSRSSES